MVRFVINFRMIMTMMMLLMTATMMMMTTADSNYNDAITDTGKLICVTHKITKWHTSTLFISLQMVSDPKISKQKSLLPHPSKWLSPPSYISPSTSFLNPKSGLLRKKPNCFLVQTKAYIGEKCCYHQLALDCKMQTGFKTWFLLKRELDTRGANPNTWFLPLSF